MKFFYIFISVISIVTSETSGDYDYDYEDYDLEGMDYDTLKEIEKTLSRYWNKSLICW